MTNDEKPQIKKIDPKSFVAPLEGLAKLKALLGDLDEFAETVKSRAVKADNTLTNLATFVEKLGQTVVGLNDVVEMNKKLFENMLKNAKKNFDDIAQ